MEGRKVIGPALPPGLSVENSSSSIDDNEDSVIGPALPSSKGKLSHSTVISIGPSLPKGFSAANQNSACDNTRGNVIGPSLPPGFKVSNESSSSEDSSIGPFLPPGMKIANQNELSSDEDEIGPALPQGRKGESAGQRASSIGPELPSNLRKMSPEKPDSGSDKDSEDDSFMGPALPPGFKVTRTESVLKGPMLPPGYANWSKGGNSAPDSEEEDDLNVVGPLPSEMARGSQRSNVVEEFEERANSMKDKLSKKDEDVPLARESWMLELPPEMGTNFGLSARKFRTNPSTRGGDRSGWTDTPADKARKEQEARSGKSKRSQSDEAPESQIMSARDKMIAEQVNTYNQNKRKDTLLEIHQTERKKKKKEENPEEETVRRPFDRDRDLQVNRFDDAQRKSVIKKSQQLNTRFSHGGSQFL